MTVTSGLGEVLRDADGVRLQFIRTFDAPIADVWSAITDPERMQRWVGTWTGDAASGRVLFAMTESSPMRRQVVRWATVGFVLYSAFDFGWFKNSLAAAAVSLVLALAWVATGHDKGLNRDVDLRLPRHWFRRTKV